MAMSLPSSWPPASWLNEPPHELVGDDLIIEAAEGSDFWRTTSYGFQRDTGHALLTPLPQGSAVTVSFVADFPQLYDQAGVFVRVSDVTWAKAGVETSDGAAQLSAVVTHERSDWSMAPVPDWAGRLVTIRVSRLDDALIIRARVESEPWRMIRVAHLEPSSEATAGPFCCAPERAGLRVRFRAFEVGPGDAALHVDPDTSA